MKRLLAGVLALSLTAAASAGDFRLERDIPYGSRLDQPGEGGKQGHRSGQFFDLYWPNEVTTNTLVFLYVHGGAWSQKWDKDVDGWHILSRLAERGIVCCSMNYVLQNDVLTDPKMPNRPNATFADMLRDIDLMISYLAPNLPTRGLSPRKIGIGGTSAGAHLSALYACDGANPAALGLNLRHALPIGFVFDNVGPMDFSTPQMLLSSSIPIQIVPPFALANPHTHFRYSSCQLRLYSTFCDSAFFTSVLQRVSLSSSLCGQPFSISQRS